MSPVLENGILKKERAWYNHKPTMTILSAYNGRLGKESINQRSKKRSMVTGGFSDPQIRKENLSTEQLLWGFSIGTGWDRSVW